MSTAFKRELAKFDSERALPAWDGLLTKQQIAMESLGVPTMFSTTTKTDREVRNRFWRLSHQKRFESKNTPNLPSATTEGHPSPLRVRELKPSPPRTFLSPGPNSNLNSTTSLRHQPRTLTPLSTVVSIQCLHCLHLFSDRPLRTGAVRHTLSFTRRPHDI